MSLLLDIVNCRLSYGTTSRKFSLEPTEFRARKSHDHMNMFSFDFCEYIYLILSKWPHSYHKYSPERVIVVFKSM